MEGKCKMLLLVKGGEIWLRTSNILAIAFYIKDPANGAFRDSKAKIFRDLLKWHSTSKGFTCSNKLQKLECNWSIVVAIGLTCGAWSGGIG
jgi:hypothetical protein